MPDLDQPKQDQGEMHTFDQGEDRLPRVEAGLSIFEVLSILLRRRVLIIGMITVTTGISVVLAATKPTLYTSSAVFLPESSESSSIGGAAALAQQFGVSLGSSSTERTPPFYAELVTSVEVLRQTVTEPFVLSAIGEDLPTTDLVSYYKSEGQTEAARIELAMLRLQQDLSVSVDRGTNVVRFSVTTGDPQLSQGVAQHILDLVHNFDVTTRQTQAGAERKFSEERMAEATVELRTAEDNLKSFLTQNRAFSNSTSLQFEHDRLQRVVAMRQELATSLMSAYESARIEEVRNTPVITVIESPRVPPIRDPKGRFLMLVVGVILGLISGILAAFLTDSIDKSRQNGSAGLQELSSVWDQVVADVGMLTRRPFRRLSK